MDSTAIDAIAKLAIEAASANHLGTPTPAIIIDNKVVSVEHLQAGRSRFRGTFRTTVLADFVEYVTGRTKTSEVLPPAQCFVDADKWTATTFFNLGHDALPGHCDDTAVLSLKKTAAYDALCAISQPGVKHSQRALSDFIEEWSEHITALDSSGENITVALAVQAIRDVKIKKSGEANTAVTNFGAKRSALEEIEAKANGIIQLPASLLFRVVPFAGFAEQIAEIKLSVLTGDDTPIFVARWARREQVIEAIADDFQQRLSDLVGESASTIVGTFTP